MKTNKFFSLSNKYSYLYVTYYHYMPMKICLFHRIYFYCNIILFKEEETFQNRSSFITNQSMSHYFLSHFILNWYIHHNFNGIIHVDEDCLMKWRKKKYHKSILYCHILLYLHVVLISYMMCIHFPMWNTYLYGVFFSGFPWWFWSFSFSYSS